MKHLTQCTLTLAEWQVIREALHRLAMARRPVNKGEVKTTWQPVVLKEGTTCQIRWHPRRGKTGRPTHIVLQAADGTKRIHAWPAFKALCQPSYPENPVVQEVLVRVQAIISQEEIPHLPHGG